MRLATLDARELERAGHRAGGVLPMPRKRGGARSAGGPARGRPHESHAGTEPSSSNRQGSPPLAGLSPAALSAARQAMARVKARRSAESAVFLRDMLEYKMEYDEVSASRVSPSKVLQHRPDYSFHQMLQGMEMPAEDSASAGDANGERDAGGRNGAAEGGASPGRGPTPVSSSFVAPRKYLFESPPAAKRDQTATPRSDGSGAGDADVDYIKQLAAEEFAGLSCYALLGVARRLDSGSDYTAGGREADLAFALEHSRSECVLWKAKEELARSSVSRVLNEYQVHTYTRFVCVCVCVCVCVYVCVCARARVCVCAWVGVQ